MDNVRFVMNSDLGDVAFVAVAVNAICIYLGFTDVQASEIELCIVEAVTNAIRHAYHGETGQTVSVGVSLEGSQLHIEISDRGTPIPPEQVTKLLHGTAETVVDVADISLLSEGGRGLQIIHDVMDRISYTHDGGLNRLELIKQVPVKMRQR